MAYTLVLEASAERIESSSLSRGTKINGGCSVKEAPDPVKVLVGYRNSSATPSIDCRRATALRTRSTGAPLSQIFMADSYNGYYGGLSIRSREFDPPIGRHGGLVPMAEQRSPKPRDGSSSLSPVAIFSQREKMTDNRPCLYRSVCSDQTG